MKLKIAQKWVEALRSGKYRQGKMALKTKSKRGTVRHCCLGVLCELYNKNHKNKLKVKKNTNPCDQIEGSPNTTVFEYDSYPKTLPDKVKNWAGIDENTGQFLRGDGYEVKNQKLFHLADMNDQGASFKEIANFIEKRYQDL